MPKRNKHTLSHYRLLTGNMGLLYPVGLVEALPGDTFQHSTQIFLRMSPLAAPVMHPITVRCHHFFVPHRLTMPNWEDFITGGKDGNNADTIPTLNTTGDEGDLLDYFGLPRVAGLPVSALPTRAYNAIHREWFADEDLVTERLEDDVTVGRIAWEKDYFTMARPWTQKGDAVALPIGESAPVIPDGTGIPRFDLPGGDFAIAGDSTAGAPATWSPATVTGGGTDAAWNDPALIADLSSAEAIPINDFRRAFALQRYQEARARYGSRYTEYLRYLGIAPSDARVQIPEYLGGGRVRIATSEVLNVAHDSGPDERFGIGDMYGHGVAAMRSNAYRRTFQEHGYVLSLLSVRPKGMYTNGIERTFLRRDKEDFWQRELEQIGQQPVWDGEVYSESGDTETELYNTFGYQDRYREYRECKNQIAGEYRDVLNYWHLARDFAARPVLNESFVECNPSDRIFNVTTNDTLWMAVQHSITARRLVARRATSRIL